MILIDPLAPGAKYCRQVQLKIEESIREAQEKLSAGTEGEVDPLLVIKAIWDGVAFAHNATHFQNHPGMVGVVVSFKNMLEEKHEEEMNRIRGLLNDEKPDQALQAVKNLLDVGSHSSFAYQDLLIDIRKAITRREQEAIFQKHRGLAKSLCEQTEKLSPEDVVKHLIASTNNDLLMVMRLLASGYGNDDRLSQAMSFFPPNFIIHLLSKVVGS